VRVRGCAAWGRGGERAIKKFSLHLYKHAEAASCTAESPRSQCRSPRPTPPPTLRDAWEEIVGRCEEVGVDAFEINFSCPHGKPASGSWGGAVLVRDGVGVGEENKAQCPSPPFGTLVVCKGCQPSMRPRVGDLRGRCTGWQLRPAPCATQAVPRAMPNTWHASSFHSMPTRCRHA
jgi:hypothetical protein